MLRQLIALGVLGVLVVALFVSGVGTTSLRQTQGNLAFLRVQFPADPGQQAQDLGQATAALSGPDAMGNAYRRVQITLAPVRPCAANSVTKADAGPYTLDEDKTAELALWIERYSVIPMCLEENNVDDAAAYYSWADEAVPGVAEHYRKLTVQMASAFITRAYDKGSSHEWLAASENWTAAKTFLKGKPYNDFGDLAEKLAVDSRNVQQALLAADIAKNPTDKVARIYLAQSYNATNQGQKALDAIAPLLEDMPDDTRVWQQQGQALIALNRLAEAEAALQEAVRLAPDDLQALNRLGVLYLATGRLPQAEATFRRALASPGGSEAYWVWEHLGETLTRQGKQDQAAEAYKKSSEMKK